MELGSVTDVYDGIAEWFDAARNKSLVERECLEAILANLAPGAQVLDLGCGTAEPIARHFIESGCKITGIDGAKSMIAIAKARFPDHCWHLQDMREFTSVQKFDVILAWDSFFHLPAPDQRAMFPVFEKVSAPDAFLLFSCGNEETQSWSPMFGKEEIAMYHASLGTREYRKLLTTHGFVVVKHKTSDPECGGRTYWLARKSQARLNRQVQIE